MKKSFLKKNLKNLNNVKKFNFKNILKTEIAKNI